MGKKVFCGITNCIFQVCGACNAAVLRLAEDPEKPDAPDRIRCQSFKSVEDVKDDV